jgi:hypothetical protein
MSLSSDLRLVRVRARRHLNADVALAAGLSVGELKQVIDGRLQLAPWQAAALAIRIAIKEKPPAPDRLDLVEINRLRAVLRTFPRRTKLEPLAQQLDIGINALTLFISGDGTLAPAVLQALAAALADA